MNCLRAFAAAVAFTLLGCDTLNVATQIELTTTDDPGSNDGGGSGGGGGVVDAGPADAFYDGGTGGIPCDIAVMVKEKCLVCHGNPVAGNATFALQTRADFLQPSFVDPSKSLFQQARIRIHNPLNPMPPVGYQQPTLDEVVAFDHWEMAAAPEGACTTATLPPQPTTCASNTLWPFGNAGSAGMNPGYACRSCHLGQNFNGQNPGGVSKTTRAYFFIGTVFADAHGKDLCESTPPPGSKIEILDKNGVVAQTLTPNAYGNFFSTSTTTTIALPYTARVVSTGKTARMLTPQTNGDCNSCHTVQGLQNAPGRIYWPPQ